MQSKEEISAYKKAYHKVYYAANKEEIIAHSRADYAANKEKMALNELNESARD